MSHWGWLIAETCRGYQLLCPAREFSKEISSAELNSAEHRVLALRRALAEAEYAGEPVVFAMDSHSCLARTFPLAGRTMRRNRQSLAYALETYLPLAAEDAVCDFLVFAQDALGIAVETRHYLPLFSGLEKAGVHLVSITPFALLAVQAQLAKRPPEARRIVVWQNDARFELIELRDDQPYLWRLLPSAADDVVREIRELLTHPAVGVAPPIEGWNLCGDMHEEITSALGAECSVQGVDAGPIENAAAQGAANVILGSLQPWFEFHRDGFGAYDPYRSVRGRFRALVVAVASLMLAASAACWIRADKYAQLAESYEKRQQEVYRRVFPTSPLPMGICARLESEHRKLAGITGQVAGMPQLMSSLELLQQALAPLPSELRYRLIEFNVDERRIDIEGEVRQHGDADTLVMALRGAGLEVAPPRTEALSTNGIAVTLHANRPSSHADNGKSTKAGSP